MINLKDTLRNKIVQKVFNHYDDDWSILVYDDISGRMISELFAKSQLVDFFISEAFHIETKKPVWDFPVTYFVHDSEDNFATISEEFEKHIFSKYTVVVIGNSEMSYFSSSMKFKVIYFNCSLQIIEDRVFLSDTLNNLHESMETLFGSYLNLFTMKGFHENIDVQNSQVAAKGDMLVLDRPFDFFTPLLHFFTFRSIDVELAGKWQKREDVLWPEVRNVHLAKVNDILRYYIQKLSANMDKLDKNIDTDELSKMVMEAPENIKIKHSISNCSELQDRCLVETEYLQRVVSDSPIYKNLIETELVIATGVSRGEKIQKIELQPIFNLFESPNIRKEHKERLLYLLKLKGTIFTKFEKQVLINLGFKTSDINFVVDTSAMYLRTNYKPVSKYEISRFEPFLQDIILDFVGGNDSFFEKKNNFVSTGNQALTSSSSSTVCLKEENIFSLRKTRLITSSVKKANNRILVIFINNGIAPEEIRLAYDLSLALGVEIIIGSNKILKPSEIITDMKKK